MAFDQQAVSDLTDAVNSIAAATGAFQERHGPRAEGRARLRAAARRLGRLHPAHRASLGPRLHVRRRHLPGPGLRQHAAEAGGRHRPAADGRRVGPHRRVHRRLHPRRPVPQHRPARHVRAEARRPGGLRDDRRRHVPDFHSDRSRAFSTIFGPRRTDVSGKQGGLGSALLRRRLRPVRRRQRIGQISSPRDVLDFTSIKDSAYERQYGLRSGAIAVTSFFRGGGDWGPGSGTMTGLLGSAGIALLPRTDEVATVFIGQALQNPAASVNGKQLNYDPTRGTDGSLTLADHRAGQRLRAGVGRAAHRRAAHRHVRHRRRGDHRRGGHQLRRAGVLPPVLDHRHVGDDRHPVVHLVGRLLRHDGADDHGDDRGRARSGSP